MLRTALAYDDGPVAFRYPRGTAEGVPLPEPPREIEIGKGEVLQEGERVALLGYGWGVQVANDAAAILAERGLRPTVADARFAKPLDAELVDSPRRRARARRHDRGERLPGGFGAAVLEHVEDSLGADRARIMRVGLPDRYVTHGKPSLLREEVGLTGDAVAERVLAALGVSPPSSSSARFLRSLSPFHSPRSGPMSGSSSRCFRPASSRSGTVLRSG